MVRVQACNYDIAGEKSHEQESRNYAFVEEKQCHEKDHCAPYAKQDIKRRPLESEFHSRRESAQSLFL